MEYVFTNLVFKCLWSVLFIFLYFEQAELERKIKQQVLILSNYLSMVICIIILIKALLQPLST